MTDAEFLRSLKFDHLGNYGNQTELRVKRIADALVQCDAIAFCEGCGEINDLDEDGFCEDCLQDARYERTADGPHNPVR